MPSCPTLLLLLVPFLAFAQPAELVPVVSKAVSRTVDLPGEFLPFLSVPVHAKVSGYVEKILMTAAAMICGMVPMAIGIGETGSQAAPLGRTATTSPSLDPPGSGEPIL